VRSEAEPARPPLSASSSLQTNDEGAYPESPRAGSSADLAPADGGRA
jgi:hypothetical protein